MANPEHLKILQKGVTEWNAWRKSDMKIAPDLSGADLTSAKLFGALLTNTNLTAAKLTDAELNKVNFAGANLSNASARKAKFSGAFLFAADLTGADLTEAWLQNSYLNSANLSQCNLTCASLYYADLDRANFTGSNLTGADLQRSVLDGTTVAMANFTQAIFGATVFGGLDLSTAKGLELAAHRGPSTIGIDTFFKSKGRIPQTFLRGAGVPEDFIQYAATLSTKTIEYYSCFISYSHADMAFAQRLHDVLQSKGIRCWQDEKQLLPGDHIHKEIDEAIRYRDKVLLCCSKNSLQSWWVDKEISKAINKEEQLSKERGEQVLAIIPLDLDGFMFDPQCTDWKKNDLSPRKACVFKGWEKDNGLFDRQVDEVVRALRADSGNREKHPKPRL